MNNKLTSISYKSIPHMYPYLKDANEDGTLTTGQVEMLTIRKCPDNAIIYVTEKIDGSNMGVWKQNGELIVTNRYGYSAKNSDREFHRQFYLWVMKRKERFLNLLSDGEHVCGEWLILRHGTIYNDLNDDEMFQIFDIKGHKTRLSYNDIFVKVHSYDLNTVPLLHKGCEIEPSKLKFQPFGKPLEGSEGLVYRYEIDNIFQFIGKILFRPLDSGKYL